jgi:hypothetical protein
MIPWALARMKWGYWVAIWGWRGEEDGLQLCQ